MPEFWGHNESGGPRHGQVWEGTGRFAIRTHTIGSGDGVTVAPGATIQRTEIGALVLPTTRGDDLEVGWFEKAGVQGIRFWIREPRANAYGWSVVVAPKDTRIVVETLGIKMPSSGFPAV